MDDAFRNNHLDKISELLEKYKLSYTAVTIINGKCTIVLEEKNNREIGRKSSSLENRKKNLEDLVHLLEKQGAQIINKFSYKYEIDSVYELFLDGKYYYTFVLIRD